MFVGPNVSFLTPIHPLLARERILRFTSEGRPYTKEACKPISVGDRVWIGGNAVILPGVTIGSDTVIGAGSVVTKYMPPYSIAAGNPAKIIRKIGE